MPPSMPYSCPVDEHQVGICISEDFQKMRRQHVVQGGEEQLSILRREYQRRADLQDLPFMSRRADQHQPQISKTE